MISAELKALRREFTNSCFRKRQMSRTVRLSEAGVRLRGACMADHDSLPAVLSGAKLTQSGLIAELGTLPCTVTVGLTAADRRREDEDCQIAADTEITLCRSCPRTDSI